MTMDFYIQVLWELLFLGLELWDEEPLCGARALCSFVGGLCSHALPLGAQRLFVVVVTAHFVSLAPSLLLVLLWLFLYILRHMCYDQLNFRWFSKVIVL